MPWTDDPDEMTAEQRQAEIGAIFARGILRLKTDPILTDGQGSQDSRKSAPSGLEVRANPRLSVHSG